MGARDFVDADEMALEVIGRYYPAPPVMRGSVWADTYRRVAKGPEKGLWRTSRTPYLREPLDCMDPENPVHKVIMQFATQLGKSEVIYNSIFKRIHLSPMDMMMVQPTLQDAKDHSSQRFTPTAKHMPEVVSRIAETRSRDETNTLLTKEIADGSATLFFAGANSARSLASKPLGFAACDEVDGYPLDVDGEGDPLGLVWERMSNFPNRKMLLCSTPTTRDFSRIESEYLASDRRRYWVPCPHCSEAQVLVWGSDADYGIKWLKTAAGEARADTAVYVCRHCGASIDEHNKTAMLAGGNWIPEAPGAQRGLVAGFHLNKIYSPLGWKSWPMLVEDWRKAREALAFGDNSKLKTFINTSLAETWEEQGDKTDLHVLRKRALDLPLRVVQGEFCVLTLGVDVQGNRLHLGLWGWGRGMTRQLVDRHVIWGDPALPESHEGSPWAMLTAYRLGAVENVHGNGVELLCTMVDSSDQTHAVYAYCRAHRYERVHALKGASQAGKPIIGKPSLQDVNYRGEKIKRGVHLWPIGTDTAKTEFYGALRVERPGAGFVLLSSNLPPETFEQLTAERLVTRYIKGRPRLEWVLPNGKRNEDLDCQNYARAGAMWSGVDRYSLADWARLEKKLGPKEPPKKVRDDEEETPPPAPAPRRRRRGTIGATRGVR